MKTQIDNHLLGGQPGVLKRTEYVLVSKVSHEEGWGMVIVQDTETGTKEVWGVREDRPAGFALKFGQNHWLEFLTSKLP